MIKKTIISEVKIEPFKRDWWKKFSFGEVKIPSLFSPRTSRPSLGGPFDPRIFGPFLNYECYCGKYKGKEHKGIECDRCGVLIAEKIIRRWRMGHIVLPYPITNMFIFKNLSSVLSRLLKISVKDLENIIDFKSNVVINKGKTSLLENNEIISKKIEKDLILGIFKEAKDWNLNKEEISKMNELKYFIESDKEEAFIEDYLDFFSKHLEIEILTGSEAFEKLLKKIDLDKEIKEILENKTINPQIRADRLKFLKGLKRIDDNLENWMIIDHLPVIPSELRPLTELDGNVVASRINDYYRTILIIKERLENLEKMSSIIPREIIYNERRRLQDAVKSLMYGNEKSLDNKSTNNKKSLSQSLSGKEGILRRYSLGKRVDYSARSVIIPNPSLLINQIGIPTSIALNIFKFVIIRKLLEQKRAFTIKDAEKMILNNDDSIFPILKEIVSNGYKVIANRAPSLHRPSIQAFDIVLTTNSKCIELSVSCTTAFNADFDGDVMSLYFPMSKLALEEILDEESSISSKNNIIDPKNNNFLAAPSQDIVVGISYLSEELKGEKLFFFDKINNLEKLYYERKISLHQIIAIPIFLLKDNFKKDKRIIFTTLGKIIFNKSLPNNFPYYINFLEKYLKEDDYNLDDELFEAKDIENRWKKLIVNSNGWNKKDLIAFLNKLRIKLRKIISHNEIVNLIDNLKEIGFKYSTISGITISPFDLNLEELKEEHLNSFKKNLELQEKHHSEGFFSDRELEIKKIEIVQGLKDKLQSKLNDKLKEEKNKKNKTSIYRIWNSGARASIDNLTQILLIRGIIVNYSGKTIKTPIISSLLEGLSPFEFFISIYGARKGMIDTALKTAESGYLTRRLVEAIQNVITTDEDCKDEEGILLKRNNDILSFEREIYGRFLSKDLLNNKGEKILSSDNLILEDELELIRNNNLDHLLVRSPTTCKLEKENLCIKCYGIDLSKTGELISIGSAVGIIAAQSLGEPGTQLTMRTFHSGGIFSKEDIVQGLPKVKQILDNNKISKEEKSIISKFDGKIIFIDEKFIKQKTEKGEIITYVRKNNKELIFRIEDFVKKGEKITEGNIDLQEYLDIVGRTKWQEYVKDVVRKVYNFQGIVINGKHFEIITRQMLSLVRVEDPGDSDYLLGDLVNYYQIEKYNKNLILSDKKSIKYKNIISNLKDLASYPSSFIAAVSFQDIKKLVSRYLLYLPVDKLDHVKANLITGQLIPLGKGFEEKKKLKKIINV